MIGDSKDDVGAGQAAGCFTVLVANGDEGKKIALRDISHLIVDELDDMMRYLNAMEETE